MDLEVRPWRDEDAEALNAALLAGREHLRPFMVWAGAPPMSVPERRAWFAEQSVGGARLFGAWEDGVLVGSVGLHDRIGPGGLEIGYWVHVDHLRRGVATALARRAVAIAFEDPGVTHVEIHHDVANPVSGRVAAALGFTPLGEVRGPAVTPPAGTGTDLVWRLRRAGAS